MRAKYKFRVCSVVGAYVGVLQHFISHYQGIGAHSIHLGLHLRDEADPVRDQVTHLAKINGVEIEEVVVGPWHEHTNAEILCRIRRRFLNDWFIIADQDELQVYPCPVGEIIEYCELNDFDSVGGCFIDRITADGTFPEVTPDDIWGQFPVGGFIAYPLLGSYPKKVVMCKAQVQVSHGQHWAKGAKQCPHTEHFVQIHHFKWVQGLDIRLAERANRYRSGEWKLLYEGSPAESERFIEHYTKHGCKLDITDPQFLLARCDSRYESYAHWMKLISIVKSKGFGKHRL